MAYLPPQESDSYGTAHIPKRPNSTSASQLIRFRQATPGYAGRRGVRAPIISTALPQLACGAGDGLPRAPGPRRRGAGAPLPRPRVLRPGPRLTGPDTLWAHNAR